MDVGSSGPHFTWCNGRSGHQKIRERLDKGLANEEWLSLFPGALVKNLPRFASDHAPIFLDTNGALNAGPKPFRFESCWIKDEGSRVVVDEAWSKAVWGSAAFCLVLRINSTKKALRKWNREVFSSIQTNIKLLQDRLESIQGLSPFDLAWEAEQRIQSDLLDILRMEESLWKQKSRVSWLATTDLNTRFFHVSTIIRRRRNNIDTLLSDDGHWIHDRQFIGDLAVGYFQNLFTSSYLVLGGDIDSLIQPIISEEENVSLCRMPSPEEIKAAVFQLGALKSPGLDGMSVLFFQHHWSSVENALIAMVNLFFRSGYLLKQINHSFIVLLPKVDHPSKIEQFRPISLCNVAYKVIAKFLSSRLKGVLSSIISPYQAAFVPGRTIQENAIIGQEVLHSMKAKRGHKGLTALKLDMEKAYDCMEWSFLLKVLKAFGFADKWVGWIEQCITTVSFSVMLNGSPFGFFKPGRGLRQRDPLSPFLFILGSEVLSRMLGRVENYGLFHGIKVSRRALSLSHLLFADDIMIFSRANTREVNQINIVLEEYARLSGQKINKAKSSLFCSGNTHPEVVVALCNSLQVKKMAMNNKYLGLLLFI